MPTTTCSAIAAAVIVFLSLNLRSSSSAVVHHRRVLHQPYLPQDLSPSTPPIPSSSSPLSPSTLNNTPFFPSYVTPPPPPPPVSFITFPANVPTLGVKSKSVSPQLIGGAVAAVIASVAIAFIAVFLHKRHTESRRSPSYNHSKSQKSGANSTTTSIHQAPNDHHQLPKLERPSQTSADFLYLATLVNSQAAADAGGLAYNGSNTTADGGGNTPNPRKMGSPELHPLPPLTTQLSCDSSRRNHWNNSGVSSSRGYENEDFYSPRGLVNGRESYLGTGSASRRAFAAVEIENFNRSSSNPSSTLSGTISPMRPVSPSVSRANSLSSPNSIPKSPNLIEIQNLSRALDRQMPRGTPSQESASPSPPSSSSPYRYSGRSQESSPPICSKSDQKTESPRIISGSVQNNKVTAITTLPPSPPPPPPPSPPPPPPPPPPPLPVNKGLESPTTPTLPPFLVTPLQPIALESPTSISPFELPRNVPQSVEEAGDKTSPVNSNHNGPSPDQN